MKLNEKDLELIAKIDERLKHYTLLNDNEQPITEQKERWKPAYNEKYWYVDSSIKVWAITNVNDSIDKSIINSGNCFKTEKEADNLAEAIRETLKNL